jgi:hypothetical protein
MAYATPDGRPEAAGAEETDMRDTISRAGRALALAAAATCLVAATTQGAKAPAGAKATPAAKAPTAEEARTIAREAYVYGFPMVDAYRIQHAYFVDLGGPEFKAPWNQLHHEARVYGPADRAVQTPNSDTPYSMAGLDLRAEPVVVTVPPIRGERYFSVQLVDAYTHNFAYLGSRATGNGGGSFLVTGPGWKGAKPKGVEAVLRCETSLALAIFRTQLLGPGDLDGVKAVQAGYGVQPLSRFLGRAAPKAAPAVEFPRPLGPEQQRTSLAFFDVLAFVLRFAPEHPDEKALRASFARIGVAPGKRFEPETLAPELRQAIADGMADAWKEYDEFKRARIDTGQVTSGELFGTRESLKGDHLRRMAGAVMGIFGNSREEALYPVYTVDSAGTPLDGSRRNYALRFAPGELPPVDAFWSLTLYALPSSLLSANPIDRYLVNSSMLAGLRRDGDGGVTLLVQHDSPGTELEPNWLPAPEGPFFLVLRLYRPQPAALDGAWKQPPLRTFARPPKPAPAAPAR